MILGSQSSECSCRVISVILKAQHVQHALVFQWQSSNGMTQDLGSLQLLTFLLVFCLLILLMQRIRVLKWMYFSWSVYCEVLWNYLICNCYLGLFELFQLFHLIGELIFTSWRKVCNEQKHTSLLKRLLNVFQDKRRNWWKEIKSKSWAFLRWYNLLVCRSPPRCTLTHHLSKTSYQEPWLKSRCLKHCQYWRKKTSTLEAKQLDE